MRCVSGLNNLRVCLCYSWQYFLWRLSIKLDEKLGQRLEKAGIRDSV